MSAGDLPVVKVAMQLAANMSTGDKRCTSALWRTWWPRACEDAAGALSGTFITKETQAVVRRKEYGIPCSLWQSCPINPHASLLIGMHRFSARVGRAGVDRHQCQNVP